MPADETNLPDQAILGLLEEALAAGPAETPPDPPDEWHGDAFPYLIERFAGRGGSGFVWKASRRTDGRLVALKLVYFKNGDPLLKQRWSDEISTLETLGHRNLVRIVDHGVTSDLSGGWFALEWIEGICLGRLLQQHGPLPWKRVLHLADQLCTGLATLHQAGFVHRDIKPSNLLLETETDRLVIADLGIVAEVSRTRDDRLTRTLERLATPGYAPPEQTGSNPVPHPSADQFSLAVTLWELLTGQRPVGAFPKLQSLVTSPPALDRALRRALNPNPAKRFPGIPHLARVLRRIARTPLWLMPLLKTLALLAILTLATTTAYHTTRPDPFPKRFQSGPLRVNAGRQQFIHVDFTLEQSGRYHAKLRITSQDLFFGFDGRAHLTLRDAKGNIIQTLKSDGFGVNGRLIPGAKHDRLETWTGTIPAATAQRVKIIDFAATPSAGKLQTRVKDNQRRFQRDVDALKSGLKTGLKALGDMFSLTPPND
jgi:serine/threonine protein kinase